MGKYRRHSSGSRYGRTGLMISLGAGGVVIVLIKLFHLFSSVNTLNEAAKQDQQVTTLIVFIDSTGKKDTLPLDEYRKRYPATDTTSH